MRLVLVMLILVLSIFSFSISSVKAYPIFSTDTTSQVNCTNTTHACSAIVTTSFPNDVIIVFQDTHLTPGGCALNNFNVTDSQNLSWTQRTWGWNLTFNSPTLVEWWTRTSSLLVSDNITEYIHTAPFPGQNCVLNQYNGITVWAINGNQLTMDPSGGTAGLGMGNSPNENVTGTFNPTKNGLNELVFAAVAHGSNIDYGKCCTGIVGSGTQQGIEYAQLVSSPYTITFSSTSLSSWALIIDAIYSPILAGRPSSPPNFQSAPGPGGFPIPPQLADQNVLSLMGIISGIILLSSVPGIEKQKKRKDSFI